MSLRRISLLLACACGWLVACQAPETPPTASDPAHSEPLPAPNRAAGSVTGMPDEPGPGRVGPPPETGAPLDAEGNPLLPAEASGDAETNAAVNHGNVVAPPAEPAPEAAAAVIRDYYAAIQRGDFNSAHALWGDGGRASGQSAAQFASGFADTTGLSVEVMPPSRLMADADFRFIEVPVAVTSTHRDGRQRRYVGAYVLRYPVGAGASGPRTWQIGSADLREVQP